MPSQVNRVPPGLLSLLGIKASGQNPSILPDTLTPTLELLDLYMAGNAQEVVASTSAVNLVGIWGVASLQPGPGELYLVERMSVSTTTALAAGTTYEVQPMLYEASTGARRYTVGPRVGATVGQVFCTASERPFIVTPGYRLGAFVSVATLGVAQQFAVAVRYVPLTV